MAKTLNISEAAERLGVTVRRVQQLCQAGKLPGAVKNGRDWDIPTTAHVRLMDDPRPDKEFDLTVLPKHKQDTALWRRGIIQEAEAFAAAEVRQGRDRLKALRAFAAQAKVSLRSLQRWMSSYRTKGVEGLVDTRGMSDGPAPEISPEAWNEFLSLWLVPSQPSVRQCLDIVLYKSQSQNLNWRLPGLRRMQQMAIERIPEGTRVLYRQGEEAYQTNCAPFIVTDLNSVEPGAVWIGDHHQFDCWVMHRGKWIRPWITAWEDMRSRTIVGYCITASPNSTTILIAFRRGCEAYGPPAMAKIDNGKDYDSELFTGTTKQKRRLKLKVDETNVTGLYAMMDIKVSFAEPYHPQSKAIERWFDTLEGQFVRMMPTYCGKDTQRRPEHLVDYLKTPKAIEEALTLEEFSQMCDEYIAIYNNTAHTGRGMDGRTPIQVMRTRPARRVVDPETLALLCQVWVKSSVGQNGVRVKGLYYGQYDHVLKTHLGREVRCAYDPDNMSTVRVYEYHTYRYITTAETNAMIGGYGTQVCESDVREAKTKIARAKKQVKQFKPAAKIAATSLPHLALAAARSRTLDAAPEENKPMRPVRTPLDGQAAAVRRTERVRAVKRAAGAESMRSVIDLRLDAVDVTERHDLPNLGLDGLGSADETRRKVDLKLYE